VTLRGGHRLRVLGKWVLRRLFGLERDEIVGDWRKLRNDELRNLYSSPNTIRMIKLERMRRARQVARTEEKCIQCFERRT
jgi:hypothetical protein